MAAKYKTRKELLKKPDEFITLTGKAIAFTRDYQNQIFYALKKITASPLSCKQINYYYSSPCSEAFSPESER